MSHGRSIATVCLSGTLEEKLAAAAGAGFDAVEIFENDLVVSPLSPRGIRDRCADLNLRIALYQPFRDFEGGSHRAALARAEHKFALMEALGADTLLVCSSVAPDAAEDDDVAAGQLAELATRAGERGLRIAYEALAWGRHVSTWERAWSIVRRAGHPSLGLCLDSFHILSRTPDPSGIAAITPGKVFFVQLADAPRLSMDVLQWSRHHRLFPGQGAFDLPRFLRYVDACGYTGPLSLEVFNDVFRQSDPARTAVDAMRSLAALAPLPPSTAPTGHAFAELAVDGRSGPRLRDGLRALGFAHTGQHRTKPVELWECGSCRIVLNSAVTRPGPPGDASVAAFALTSTDPGASLRRAAALLAPARLSAREPGETELAAVTAPDGTDLLVTRPEDDWRDDFLPVAPAADGPLTGIDHVGLTQPYDRYDEAALFYRSVLGLAPSHADEYAAPYGLVRSLAMTTGDRSVRLALSVSRLRRGEWAPAVRDPQHIAFATDDIVAAARLAPVLRVSDNYYDDLAARFALPAPFVATLRTHGILYDRDAGGAELLHFFTPVYGNRVFFEVVERRGGYDGYGEANAPVRSAAHRYARE